MKTMTKSGVDKQITFHQNGDDEENSVIVVNKAKKTMTQIPLSD